MASPAMRFGRYEVRATLGSGAMGTVYSGWDPELQRRVAIKVIKNQLSHDDLARFQREARTLAQLSHRHIVGIHDIGTKDDAPFIVMEYVDGRSLSSEIEQGIPRSVSEKINFAAEICDALAFAHRAGVLHRDVKPANILITTDGAAKLADFGLARMQSSSLTASANLVGTPAYLPPEAFAGEAIDERADVYGVAASLYEWLCGARPHDADHLATLIARVMSSEPPDIRIKWPECPDAIADCLSRGLARDRAHRFESAAAFAAALRALPLDIPHPSDLVATVHLGATASRSVFRNWAVTLGVGVTALAAVAIATYQPPRPDIVSEAPRVSSRAKSDATAQPSAPQTRPASLAHVGTIQSALEPTPKTPERLPEATAGVTEPPPTDDERDDPPMPTIPIGSKVLVRVLTELRTDRSRPGDVFQAQLAEPLSWNGHEVAVQSATVQGIIDAVAQGSSDRASSMQLSLVSITIGGHSVRVRTARYEIVAPPAQRGQRALTLVIGTLTGAAIGAATVGTGGAIPGAAIGASLTDSPSVIGDAYILGDRLTFKLAEPLRVQPGTH